MSRTAQDSDIPEQTTLEDLARPIVGASCHVGHLNNFENFENRCNPTRPHFWPSALAKSGAWYELPPSSISRPLLESEECLHFFG